MARLGHLWVLVRVRDKGTEGLSGRLNLGGGRLWWRAEVCGSHWQYREEDGLGVCGNQ